AAELLLAVRGAEHRHRARMQDALDVDARGGARGAETRGVEQRRRRHTKAGMPSRSRPMISRCTFAVPSMAVSMQQSRQHRSTPASTASPQAPMLSIAV